MNRFARRILGKRAPGVRPDIATLADIAISEAKTDDLNHVSTCITGLYVGMEYRTSLSTLRAMSSVLKSLSSGGPEESMYPGRDGIIR